MTRAAASLFGYSGRYRPIGASSCSLPAATSCSVATAVNILFIDPMRKRVSIVFGTCRDRSASPSASEYTVRPSRSITITPAN